jgi:hypothetical protein
MYAYKNNLNTKNKKKMLKRLIYQILFFPFQVLIIFLEE